MKEEEYKPISCTLHDSLESFCVKRTKIIVVYNNKAGDEKVEDSVIEDVYSEKKEEFILLKSGTVVRLDNIIQINEVDFKK